MPRSVSAAPELPIPLEVIMCLAGFSAGQDKLNLAGVGVIVATYLYRVATWRAK